MMRVLFLPGSWDLTQEIVAVLNEEGHTVTFVLETDDLQKAGHALNYDLLLVDLGFSAFDVVQFLESQARFNQKQRTLLYTAEANRLLQVLALGYDVEQCLAEPFVRKDLVEKLRLYERDLHDRLNAEARLLEPERPPKAQASSSTAALSDRS
jgi:DNA-binding response OmpR family regulator